MKAVAGPAAVCFLALLFAHAGCEPGPAEPPVSVDIGSDLLSTYSSYTVANVDITPLTRFVSGGAGEQTPKITVYLDLLDSFDCRIKSPGTFRFELYEHLGRRAEPKGRRVLIWPDIDSTDAAENNKYWRDYLRSYEFSLPFQPQGAHSYVLQVTCLCPTGRRLSDDFILRQTR
jgi:hypothetical protein